MSEDTQLSMSDQVARRQAYKGNIQDLTSLPVDACTVMGILVLHGSLLPAASFGPEGVQECVSVLQALEEHMHITGVWQLLPHSDVFRLEVQDNCLDIAQLKAMLRELGLSWSRHLLWIC